MALFHPGISEAIENVRRMDEQQLLAHLDALYGRDDLPEDHTLEDLRHEAITQTRRDFTDTNSNEYRQVQFFTGLHKAMEGAV